ncbi:hypothetical protein FKG94_03310 [Exilibacterium tricleocarpae]|uniref:Uncharacterized protein n=1 Tax=Exilibacterium tricleocarpae TaxID=2591008 RepID=A0A545U6Z1_9GAMM|nr:hypothetical protein [Exilibacterium tricleocarpae]TQV85232.1 hypothetical protein FKG94_03310 [Exilibacterium tricleocarpae]
MTSMIPWWKFSVPNYRWSHWVPYIDGWIPKIAFTVPIVGYLLIFNDQIADVLKFQQLTEQEARSAELSAVTRLRLLYFGLVSLGVSNFIYRLRKPTLFAYGTNEYSFIKEGLQVFTYREFLQFYKLIQRDGNKNYDSEWGRFEHEVGALSRKNEISKSVNWEEAKRSNGNVLTEILMHTFLQNDRTNLKSLTACLVLSTIGYIFLAIPSADIFLKVVISTLPF